MSNALDLQWLIRPRQSGAIYLARVTIGDHSVLVGPDGCDAPDTMVAGEAMAFVRAEVATICPLVVKQVIPKPPASQVPA